MKVKTFGILLNCIDGRTHMPSIKHLVENYGIDYVDLITEPGMNKILSEGDPNMISSIREKVYISIKSHDSSIIFIAAHHDCAGNPVDKSCHLNHLRHAKTMVSQWNTGLEIKLIWLNENFEVEEL